MPPETNWICKAKLSPYGSQQKKAFATKELQKTIAGFDCIQAIGKINNNSTNPKKDVIAWFTPEINSSFGPKTYFGLPGLILNLKEEFLEFTCFSIVFSNQQIVKPKKGLKIKEEELNNIFMKKAKEEFKLKH